MFDFLYSIVSLQTVILQGGEDIRKRTNEQLFLAVANISSTKKILVIPWTQESEEKEMEYTHILWKYFLDSGFQSVYFLKREDSYEQIAEKFSSVDVIYLPGGDPNVLYRELNSRSLQKKLRNFKGIIIGNSAGAIVLSKGGWGDGKFYRGFGLVDFYVSVHYKLDAGQVAETKDAINVNIPENMWVMVTNER